MPMYFVFFDDSGTHSQSKVAVAACFIFDKARKEKFDEQWKSLLAAEQFDCMHYSDFLAGKQAFLSWNKDKKQRVLNRAIEIASSPITGAWEGYVTAVIKEDYDRVITGKLRQKVGSRHYTFAIQSCMAHMRARLPGSQRESVEYVFDQMTKGQGEICDLFSDLLDDPLGDYFGIRKGGWSFQSKKQFYSLQLADILACEAYRYMRDHVIGKTRAKEPVFKSCIRQPIFHPQFFDAESLAQFAGETTALYEKVGWNAPRGAFFRARRATRKHDQAD